MNALSRATQGVGGESDRERQKEKERDRGSHLLATRHVAAKAMWPWGEQASAPCEGRSQASE